MKKSFTSPNCDEVLPPRSRLSVEGERALVLGSAFFLLVIKTFYNNNKNE